MTAELSKSDSGSFKLSCGIGTVEALEGLVRGTLPAVEAAELTAHADCCLVCAKELSWLRAERELFAQRARGVPPSQVWSQVEAQMNQRLVAQLSQQRPGTRFRDRLRSQCLQWLAVGAAAALMGIFAVSPLSPLRSNNSLTSLLTRSVDGGQAAMVAPFSDDDDDDKDDAEDEKDDVPVVASAKVSGPITVSLSADSADIDVSVGPAGEVKIVALESDIHAAKLVEKSKGRLQAEFDGRSRLSSGRVLLSVPVGSNVELLSRSGEVSVQEVRGDVEVQTDSGDVHLTGARKVTVTTTSGDAQIERPSGPVSVETISGDLHLAGDVATMVKFASMSGDMQLTGACRANCLVAATTKSGDVSVHAKKASLVAHLRSHSGEVTGTGDGTVDMRSRPGNRKEWTVHLGRNEGRIDMDSDSGSLNLQSDD